MSWQVLHQPCVAGLALSVLDTIVRCSITFVWTFFGIGAHVWELSAKQPGWLEQIQSESNLIYHGSRHWGWRGARSCILSMFAASMGARRREGRGGEEEEEVLHLPTT